MREQLNLFVFTGWPGDGKTTLSRKLALDGLIRISTDELRKELYPQDYDNIPYPEGWFTIWEEVCERRDYTLVDSKNVIIDSCAHTQYIRDKFLDLGCIEEFLKEERDAIVRKYLIQLVITSEERMRRFQKDDTVDGGNFSMRRMSMEFQPLIYYKREGVSLLQLSNNDEEEQEKCYDLLRSLIS